MRPTRITAVLAAALTAAVTLASPAHAETPGCDNALNQQGARCASFTTTTSAGTFMMATSGETAGDTVGTETYNTTDPHGDTDTLLVLASGVPSLNGTRTEFQAFPGGKGNGLCYQAKSAAAGTTVVLAACGTSKLQQFFAGETSEGLTFRLAGTGSTGLYLYMPEPGSLSLEFGKVAPGDVWTRNG